MNNKESFYDQIDAFLSGQSTPDQAQALRKAMLDDPDLTREVELRRLEFDVSETLIAKNIRDQLHRLRNSQPPDSTPAMPARSHKFRHILWIVAVMLTIAAIGVYWWNARRTSNAPTVKETPLSVPEQIPPVQQSDPTPARPQAGNAPSLPAQKSAPENTEAQPARRYLALATELYQRPDIETLRGAAPATSDPYGAALSAWEKQDYKGVVASLHSIPADDPKGMRSLALRAHALFNLGQFQQAAQGFAVVSDSKIMPWSEEADWYVLLALLADGKADTAVFRTRLEKLLSDNGHPYFGRAKDMKARLAGR